VAEQLQLLQTERDEWRLDPQTKEIGLRGIAEARRILLEAMNRSDRQSEAA
jgi:hypothetical protein